MASPESSTGPAEFLFDKRNKNIPRETVFDSRVSVAFHYVFAATIVLSGVIGFRLVAILLSALTVAFVVSRNIPTARAGLEERKPEQLLHFPIEFLHRNFALVFCLGLVVTGSPDLPAIPLLLIATAIDTFREFRIYGSDVEHADDFLSRIEVGVQRILLPPWKFIGCVTAGLGVIISAEVANPAGPLETGFVKLFSWFSDLVPALNDLPSNLNKLGVPEKYGLAFGSFAYLQTCGLLYLLATFVTNQKAVSWWRRDRRRERFPRLRPFFVLFVGGPTFFALYLARLHLVMPGMDDNSGIFGAMFGTIENGVTFPFMMELTIVPATVMIVLYFFVMGFWRRI